MNGKTAKLINKVAQHRADTQSEKRLIKNDLKREWKALPHTERYEKRQQLQQELQ